MCRLSLGAIATLFLFAATPAFAQQQPSFLSVEKVRAALLKPPSKWVFEYRQPDFRVHIQDRRPLDDVFDVPLWDTPKIGHTPAPSNLAHIEGTPGNSPPLFSMSVDPGGFAHSATKAAKAKAVRTETERAIEQYCTAQPDAGSSIPLCWAASPDR
jgi:hypothetical protein